jgi:hypothetical protein
MQRLLLICLVARLATISFASEPPSSATLAARGDGTEITLPLRGTDILRWKWVVRLYHVSLYLAPSADDAVAASPKRLRMDYLRNFTRDDMVRATDSTIGRNLDAAALLSLQPSLAKWNALYPAIKAGDYLEFDHLADGTLLMRHNATVLGSLVDERFAKALFAIWIGPKPVDIDVRNQLISPRVRL